MYQSVFKKNRIKLFALLFLFLWERGAVHAFQVTGEGYGTDKKQAETEALADLCQKIHVEVNSRFLSETSVSYSASGSKDKKENAVKDTRNLIRLTSDLPLLGVNYETRKKRKAYTSIAVIDDRDIRLYEGVLKKIGKKIAAGEREISKSDSDSGKASLLRDLLVEMDQFEKYATVYLFLGGKSLPELTLTQAEIKRRLAEINPISDSLEDGLKKAARTFTKERIYIYPPTTENSSEITAFAGKVKDILSLYLKTVPQPDQADYFLQGEYAVLKNKNLELIYRLMNREQDTILAAMSCFSETAYQAYETEPKTIDFDKLLKNGMVYSGDFRATITTSSGKKDLMFKNREVFKILVKLNRPGYFYLIAHSLKEKEAYSYLVDFYTSPGNRKFIYFINADEVNKWVEIGEFQAVPPFGVESLQMIASTKDPVDSIPKTHFDPETKLYKIGAPPEQVVAATRGIIRKSRSDDAAKDRADVSEDVLTITILK